jgi:hypothetical protein
VEERMFVMSHLGQLISKQKLNSILLFNPIQYLLEHKITEHPYKLPANKAGNN